MSIERVNITIPVGPGIPDITQADLAFTKALVNMSTNDLIIKDATGRAVQEDTMKLDSLAGGVQIIVSGVDAKGAPTSAQILIGGKPATAEQMKQALTTEGKKFIRTVKALADSGQMQKGLMENPLFAGVQLTGNEEADALNVGRVLFFHTGLTVSTDAIGVGGDAVINPSRADLNNVDPNLIALFDKLTVLPAAAPAPPAVPTTGLKTVLKLKTLIDSKQVMDPSTLEATTDPVKLKAQFEATEIKADKLLAILMATPAADGKPVIAQPPAGVKLDLTQGLDSAFYEQLISRAGLDTVTPGLLDAIKAAEKEGKKWSFTDFTEALINGQKDKMRAVNAEARKKDATIKEFPKTNDEFPDLIALLVTGVIDNGLMPQAPAPQQQPPQTGGAQPQQPQAPAPQPASWPGIITGFLGSLLKKPVANQTAQQNPLLAQQLLAQNPSLAQNPALLQQMLSQNPALQQQTADAQQNPAALQQMMMQQQLAAQQQMLAQQQRTASTGYNPYVQMPINMQLPSNIKMPYGLPVRTGPIVNW